MKKNNVVSLRDRIIAKTSTKELLDWVLLTYFTEGEAEEVLELAEMELVECKIEYETEFDTFEDDHDDVFYDKEKDVELDD
jgi:hypothetical protein